MRRAAVSGALLKSPFVAALKNGANAVHSNVALIGGVRCTVNDTTSGMKTCYKHKDVFELGYRTAMNVTKWKQADHQIGLPRSSHSIIVVPQSIDYSCQADD